MNERADGPLLARVDGASAVLTLNRPDQRNALNGALFAALDGALDEAARDAAIRVVVITGAGDRAFCAGADIREMQAMDGVRAREWSLLGHRVFRRLERLPMPVLAAINGIAAGGGCELALACDLRFIADSAQLGQPEVKLGLIPGWGGTQRLPRLIGAARARELIFTGRLAPAEECLRLGLVHAITPQSELIETVLAYARQFAALPPLAIAAAKLAIDRGPDLSLDRAIALEAEQFGRLFDTADAAEGIAAFLARRAATFTGR